MKTVDFIQDLAVIMLVAGVVTVLFHRLKQPVVLGYIAAGVLIGPYTPPFKLIQDEHTIHTLSELGIVLLLFSLGLEFSLKKLVRVGATAFVVALAKIVAMVWIGYEIGRFFQWRAMDALFLGAMLAISSTTIIVKALDGLGMKQEKFAQLIFGILIIEDILAIGMIVLLSGIAMTGAVDAGDVFTTVGQLSLFMIVSLVLGLLIIPRWLDYIAGFKSNEMLLITVLGMCFGFCLLVIRLNYSIALGAFMAGAIMAEARQVHLIERLIEPVRDMFSAIFFVAIGLMFNPQVLLTYTTPIGVITVAAVIGKVLSGSLGSFLAGHDVGTSIKVGMGLAPIGEFSFIIAALGLSLKVTSEFLYPIVVAVSAITILITPYMTKLAEPLSAKAMQRAPQRLNQICDGYTTWLQSMQLDGDKAVLAKIILRILLQVLVNCALVTAVFLAGAYFIRGIESNLLIWIPQEEIQRVIVWGGALLISLPFLIATYRKLQALSMLLAQIGYTNEAAGAGRSGVRRYAFELIPLAVIVGMLFLIASVSGNILPPFEWIVAVLVCAAVVAALFWKFFVRLHTRLQIALFETMEENK